MTTTPEPSGTPPPPAAPAASGSSGGGLAVSPVPLILCVIGAVLVLVSIFLNWADLAVKASSFTANGREVPLDFLWDKNSNSEDPSLIVALIPAALLIGVGALTKLRWLALAGGIVAIGVAVAYGYQVDQLIGDLPPAADIGFFDFIGIAPGVVLVGGILGVVSALLPRPSSGA